jgi:DNA-binding Lrp family transcriptional regulator
MITAIILLRVERTKIHEVAEQLSEMDAISEVYTVSGRYEIVAIARVRSHEEISNLVSNQLIHINAIHTTETMLSLQTYSRHDLKNLFCIGMLK